MSFVRRHRSLVAALALSLVAHACALLWYRTLPSAPPVTKSNAVSMELIFVGADQVRVAEPPKVDPPPREAPPRVAEELTDDVGREAQTVANRSASEERTRPDDDPFAQARPLQERVTATKDVGEASDAEPPPTQNDDAVVGDSAAAAKTLDDAQPAIDSLAVDADADADAQAVAPDSSEKTGGDAREEEVAAVLVPTRLPSDFVLPDPEPISRGKTIRNLPGELPDAQTLRIAEEERVRTRVTGVMKDALAVAKVESGGGDEYVTTVRIAMNEAAAKPPPFDKASFPKQMVDQYRDGAARYGQSGSPYDVAHNAYDDRGQTPMERELEIARTRGPGGTGQKGTTPIEDFNNTLNTGRELRAFADGKMSNGLIAIVELAQGQDAKLLSLQLVQPSGNAVFDKFVMEVAPKSLEGVKAFAAGSHPNGLRTWWEFRGVVSYKRSVKDMNVKDDWWYVAAMMPANLVTGNFEETTGDVYLVDVRHPQYKCSVRLLRVYE